MNLFKCQNCGQLLYFENTVCERCSHRLGYIPSRAQLSALEPHNGTWRALAAGGERYRFCTNAQFGVCNWLIEEPATEDYCLACRHNRLIPNIGDQANLAGWRKLEVAKHRLIYSLLKLRLPLASRRDDPDHGLVFDFPAQHAQDAPTVLTGHVNGVITIALAEADDVEREQRRSALDEPYRTLLGHFRHESGHYYWERLVRDGARLESFRELFGDERMDYGQALQAHYANGAPGNWQDRFVSAYAAAHPWEDFAETWAHYLHMVDTLEMAGAFGLHIHPWRDKAGQLETRVDFDPYGPCEFTLLVEAWLPLTTALNSLNRAMGLPDLYPFVLWPPVIQKLGAIHDLVHGKADRATEGAKVAERAS